MRNFKIVFALQVLFLNCLSGQAPSDIDYLKGIALFQHQSYEGALLCFQNDIQSNTPNTKSFLYAGIIQLERNNIEEALNYLKQADQKEKGKSSIYMAKAYARTGNLTKCIEFLDIHLKSNYKLPESNILLDPDFERFENEKTWINFWNEGNFYSKFDRLLADADYAMNNEDYIEALNLVSEGLEKGYRKAVMLHKRADIYLLMNNEKLALEDLNDAIEYDKRDPVLFEKRGNLNYESEKYKQSLFDYNQSLKLNSDNLSLYLKRAKSYQKTGDFENALKDINFFLTLIPEEGESLYEIARIYMNEGLYLDALRYLNKSLSNGEVHSKYYHARGESFFNTRTYKSANKDLAMALDLDPENPDIWYLKGLTNLKLGDTDHACFCLKKSFQLGKKEAYDELMNTCPELY